MLKLASKGWEAELRYVCLKFEKNVDVQCVYSWGAKVSKVGWTWHGLPYFLFVFFSVNFDPKNQ